MSNKTVKASLKAKAKPGVAASPLMEQLGSAQKQAKAKFEALRETQEQLGAMREQFDHLAEKGDMVTEKDLVDASGMLVAAGLPANGVAELMSSMPSLGGGAALAGWVKSYEEKLVQSEQNLAQQMAQASYQLGHSSLRAIAGASLSAPPEMPQGPSAGMMAQGAPQEQPEAQTAAPNMMGA